MIINTGLNVWATTGWRIMIINTQLDVGKRVDHNGMVDQDYKPGLN